MKVWEVWNPALLEAEEIRALFDRAFSDLKFEMNADDVREYLKAHLLQGGETDKLFVALDAEHGYCGLSIVTLGVYPLSPLPYFSFLWSDEPEAREPLVKAGLAAIKGAGYHQFATHNGSGRSDVAYSRLFRNLGEGTVRGSVIVFDMEKTYGGQ